MEKYKTLAMLLPCIRPPETGIQMLDSAGGSSLEKTRTISRTEGQMPLKGCHVLLAVISTLEEETKYNNETLQSTAWLN